MRPVGLCLLLSLFIFAVDGYQTISLTWKAAKRYNNAAQNHSISLNHNGTSFLKTGTNIQGNGEDVASASLNYVVLQVYIGTPPQKFKLLFDTGSDITWVPSARSGVECTDVYTKFHEDKSKSFEDLKQSVSVLYDYGPYDVKLIKETVTIGEMPLNDAIIGLTVSGKCQSDFDGVLGMAPKLRNDIPPIFEYLIQNKLIPVPVFSYYLKKPKDNKKAEDKAGELLLGGWDPKFVPSGYKLNFLPVQNDAFYPGWTIDMVCVSLSEKVVSRGGTGVLDSGSSSMYTHKDTIQEIVNSVKGLSLDGTIVKAECSRIDSFPHLNFVIGDQMYTVQFSEIIRQKKGDTCVLGLEVLEIGLPGTWILGQTFLSTVYSIHDYSKKAVALVSLPRTTQPTVTPPCDSSSEPTSPSLSPPNSHSGGVSNWNPKAGAIFTLVIISILMSLR